MDAAADELDFQDLPPFPRDVPTVPLLRIDLLKLLHNDVSEVDRLWRACCNIGFFYLDLQARTPDHERDNTGLADGGSSIDGQALLEDAEQLFALGEHFFALPTEEKQRFDFGERGSYFGYKGYGKNVVDSAGTRDRNEFYNASKDFVFGVRNALPEPDLFLLPSNRELMRDFIQRSHAVVTLLLQLLERRLGLPAAGMTSLHRIDAVSGDQIRWVRAPPQKENDRIRSMGEHTGEHGIVKQYSHR